MQQVIAYTDGSAVVRGKSKGHGGFGTYFPSLDGERKAFSLGFTDTKTGRMEITALYYAIDAIVSKEALKLIVYSDSEYVVKSFTEGRLERWVQAGWKNSSGDVKNKDLWQAVRGALKSRPKLQLEMRHIRSHQVEKEKDNIKKSQLKKDPHIIGNLVADKLADYKRHETMMSCDKIKTK